MQEQPFLYINTFNHIFIVFKVDLDTPINVCKLASIVIKLD